MRRQFLCLTTSLLLGTCLPAMAQEVAYPPQVQAPGVPVQTLYAVHTVNIRSGAGAGYSVIGKVETGTAVQVVGPAPGDPHWVQLATGGYVAASVLSPMPVPEHYRHHESQQAYTPYIPPPGDYPVGSCQPYSKVVNIAGQPPQQIDGTACKQPDGTWRIVNYGVPQPIQQPPVVLQQAPPPPPVIVQQPVIVEPAPYYGPGPRYWR